MREPDNPSAENISNGEAVGLPGVSFTATINCLGGVGILVSTVYRAAAVLLAVHYSCGAAMAAVTPSGITDQNFPPQVAAVQKYILDKDYPEVFGDKHYKTKIQNVLTTDLNGDGQVEVIVHYMPHYRQSPTIVIYRVAQDMTVTRVREGLAPGPLKPISGNFLDSHTLGEAVDMTLGQGQSDPKLRRTSVEVALGEGLSVVEYVNFFHMDHRIGTAGYLDMSGLAEPPKSDNCEDFEFSPLRQISAGTVSELGAGNLLAAWAQTKVYLYRIKSFPASGLLDKEMWTVDLPEDFNGFAPGANGPLLYLTRSGAQKPFAVTCNGNHCSLSP